MVNYKDMTIDIFNNPVYMKLCTTEVDNTDVPALVISPNPIKESKVWRKKEDCDSLWKVHSFWEKSNDNVAIIANDIQYIVGENLTSEADFNTLKDIVFGIVLDARQMLGI